MQYNRIIVFLGLSILLIGGTALMPAAGKSPASEIISYTVDPTVQHIELFWKDDNGEILGSLQRLKDHLTRKNKKLVVAYTPDQNNVVDIFIKKISVTNPGRYGSSRNQQQMYDVAYHGGDNAVLVSIVP